MPLQLTATNGRADAGALGVNQLRHHFLADPGLAENQHLGLGSGGCLNVSAELDERRALAKQQGQGPRTGNGRSGHDSESSSLVETNSSR